jgi:predicted transposase YdaD
VDIDKNEELERLRSFPEINREELIRFFRLTAAAADVEFIDPGRGRGPEDRLGLGREEDRNEKGVEQDRNQIER